MEGDGDESHKEKPIVIKHLNRIYRLAKDGSFHQVFYLFSLLSLLFCYNVLKINYAWDKSVCVFVCEASNKQFGKRAHFIPNNFLINLIATVAI